MISVKDQAFISELGLRSNNEDNCGYIPGSTYVVCDGVGGLDKGEIASDIVCKSILNSFLGDIDCVIEKAMTEAESMLGEYLQENQNSQGMATTLTLAQIREDGVYLAWVGDSRIYQFRAGKINYVTKDHSWVNEALEMGLITPEESINHPKSNIITRAVQGQHKPVEADSILNTDIQANDYFLLCSDGILESWTDSELEELFQTEEKAESILEKIKAKCEKLSRDNFTAIVFKIQEADLIPIVKYENNDTVDAIPLEGPDEINLSKRSLKNRIKDLLRSKVFGIKVSLFVLAGFFLVVYWIGNLFMKEEFKELFKVPKKGKPELPIKKEKHQPSPPKEEQNDTLKNEGATLVLLSKNFEIDNRLL
jgi:protein phosphatase